MCLGVCTVFRNIYKIQAYFMDENENNKHKFLLVIDNELWERFKSTIPLNLDATKAITQMIQERVNYLESHWQEGKKDEIRQ